ncbi:hypothetical protein EVAR_70253_1 [Eumeta japonica]|uniref:Uncharacterized protein n=1 Tax=Eumeta variegata TaxID=151549 RepID=A0A4C2A7S4_EUMVA|nr:hypothetical protein EVAR_70253_1 [Eumeta japonica]
MRPSSSITTTVEGGIYRPYAVSGSPMRAGTCVKLTTLSGPFIYISTGLNGFTCKFRPAFDVFAAGAVLMRVSNRSRNNSIGSSIFKNGFIFVGLAGAAARQSQISIPTTMKWWNASATAAAASAPRPSTASNGESGCNLLTLAEFQFMKASRVTRARPGPGPGRLRHPR